MVLGPRVCGQLFAVQRRIPRTFAVLTENPISVRGKWGLRRFLNLYTVQYSLHITVAESRVSNFFTTEFRFPKRSVGFLDEELKSAEIYFITTFKL
ncbi:unnamed protein product [Lactuca virosa]|uniref:Uncharacterized protein n=1 Tax=Lactuca virosa TaxID=75947 RepID=A0AAU9MFV7_9ASTR|nr:unnamed protein product [Lactuca virosa]